MGRRPAATVGGGWDRRSPWPFSFSPPWQPSLHPLPPIKATNSSTTLASMVDPPAFSAGCGVLSPAAPAPPTHGSGGETGVSMAHGTPGQIGTKYPAEHL